jgi:hypothetical protein
MPSAKSAAVLPAAVTDKFRCRAMATGDLAAAIASCSRRLTIDAGVRAGASSPCQPAIWKPGKVSPIVGSQALCHRSIAGVGMTSRWKTLGSQRPVARNDRACTPLPTPAADDTCSMRRSATRPQPSRALCNCREKEAGAGLRCPARKTPRQRNRRLIPTPAGRGSCRLHFGLGGMDTRRGTRWAPKTTKPMCRGRELLPAPVYVMRNGNGIRHLLERLWPAYQRVPDLRGRPQ